MGLSDADRVVTAVFVPQEWHRPDSTALLFYSDGTVTRDYSDKLLTAEEVAANCAERVRMPKPWKRRGQQEGGSE